MHQRPINIRCFRVHPFQYPDSSGLLYEALKRIQPARSVWPDALFYIAVPGVFATGILAMSEMPTLCFVCLYLALITQITCSADSPKTFPITFAAFCAGLAVGLAVIGRSTMIVILPALLVGYILKYKLSFKSYVPQCIVMIACSVAVYLPVFLAWKGIIPPKIASLDAPVESLNYLNWILGMLQLALIAAIAIPKLLYINRPLLLCSIIFCLAVSCLNAVVLHYAWHSQNVSALEEYIGAPHFLVSIIGYILPGLLFGIAGHMLLNMAFLVCSNRSNVMMTMSLLSVFLLLLTQIKMFHYTVGTRHMAQIAPFVVTLIPTLGSDRFILARFFIGILLGVLLILHHLYGTPTVLW